MNWRKAARKQLNSRNLQRKKVASGGFTLIEVLVSVVILTMIITTVLWTLQSAQKGSFATAEYNQALGLATAVSQRITDNYKDSSTAFQITVPGDGLGGTSGDANISVPAADGSQSSVTQSLFQGFTCKISWAQTSVGTDSNSTNTTGSTSDFYTYTTQVTSPDGRTATVNVTLSSFPGGGSG